jgi:hypothetical protein
MGESVLRARMVELMFLTMTTAEQDEQFYRDTESVAFPKLTDEQLALLEPL